MGNLRNYTSTVPADKSIANIEKLLIEAGALNISKSINPTSKTVEGIVFQIPMNGQMLLFKLPCRTTQTLKVLFREAKRLTPTQRKNLEAQALRTAWKILHEWVDIQVSMIKLEQAELLEVFLPYAYNPQQDKTFFQLMKENSFKQLTSGEVAQ